MKTLQLSFLLLLIVASGSFSQDQNSVKLQQYIKTLEDKGEEPISFVLNKLKDYDLILFDDALHTAVEPFEFYQKLIKEKRFQERVKYVFLELVSINQQQAIDAYLEAETNDLSLLYPAFQNNFSGLGWRPKTYFDLLQTIWTVNASLIPENRLKVIAVNAPTYWSEIHTQEDVELFKLSLSGNDYTMHQIILSYMDNFRSGRKGIFLTNTRHAYKGIKNRENKYYWNCGTFFNLDNPGKTYSIRFHNINRSLENKSVKWVRNENGLWDSAFKAFGDKPIVIDLKDTPFGKASYIGNHVPDVASGQTMYDAYDALIFLAPIEKLRRTAMVDYFYTEKFKQELERRAKFLYTQEQIEEILNNYGLKSIRGFIDNFFIYEPESLEPLAKSIGAIDAWKTAK
ncbi:MAG: hypothetical protein ACE5IY_15430 [bacterium]